jgi:hypothetical protein
MAHPVGPMALGQKSSQLPSGQGELSPNGELTVDNLQIDSDEEEGVTGASGPKKKKKKR